MPIYEYQCGACGNQLEKIQKMSAEPLKICPACDTPALKKLVSAAAFRLKGAGWYETDFKTGSKKNLVQGSDAADSSAAKGGESSSGSGSSSGDSKSSTESSSATKKDSSGSSSSAD